MIGLNWTKEEFDKVRQKINEKAKVDQEFYTLCLVNPRNAIEQISGKAVPEGYSIQAIDGEIHLVRVFSESLSDLGGELSETELEQVSAGNGEVTCPYCGSAVNTRLVYWTQSYASYCCTTCVRQWKRDYYTGLPV